MKTYHDALQYVLDHGEVRDDRTGVGTIGVFGMQMRYNLEQGFPAVTTKKLAWRACVAELLWFLEGSSDERRLAELTYGTREGVTTIWTPNAMSPNWQQQKKNIRSDKIGGFSFYMQGKLGNGTEEIEIEDYNLGRIYGVQWRQWRKSGNMCSLIDYENTPTGMRAFPRKDMHVDQITDLIEGIKKDPYGRRHIISAWNPGELDQMALPPCHVLAQFYVSKDGKLSCQMYQRSCDMFLGVPFNIASYSLLTHMIAQICGLKVGEFIHTLGDAHIYQNHIAQVKEQLSREPYPLPTLWINPKIDNIFSFTVDDFKLLNYVHHEPLRAEMAV